MPQKPPTSLADCPGLISVIRWKWQHVTPSTSRVTCAAPGSTMIAVPCGRSMALLLLEERLEATRDRRRCDGRAEREAVGRGRRDDQLLAWSRHPAERRALVEPLAEHDLVRRE